MPPRAEEAPLELRNSAVSEMGSKEGSTAMDPAEIRLRELGYKQELKRELVRATGRHPRIIDSRQPRVA